MVLLGLLSQVLEHLLANLLLRLHLILLFFFAGSGIYRSQQIHLGVERVELVEFDYFVVGLLGYDPSIIFAPEVLLRLRVHLQVNTEELVALFGIIKDVAKFFINAPSAYYYFADLELQDTLLAGRPAGPLLLNRIRRRCQTSRRLAIPVVILRVLR